MSVQYFFSGDELPTTSTPLVGDDASDWLVGAQRYFVGVAIAASLASNALAAQIAVGANNNQEEWAPPTAAEVVDETYQLASVPYSLGRAPQGFISDDDFVPAEATAVLDDDDLWQVLVPRQSPTVCAFIADDEYAPRLTVEEYDAPFRATSLATRPPVAFTDDDLPAAPLFNSGVGNSGRTYIDGLIAVPDLTTYVDPQGNPHAGGLYRTGPSTGSNTRPTTILNSRPAITPVSGKLGVMFAGGSTMRIMLDLSLTAQINADPQKAASVTVINAGISGQRTDDWADAGNANVWGAGSPSVQQSLIDAGVSASQVRVVFFYDGPPRVGVTGEFETNKANNLAYYNDVIAAFATNGYTNIQAFYFSSHPYVGYSGASGVYEPLSYWDHWPLSQLVSDRDGVTPWTDLGPYVWANGLGSDRVVGGIPGRVLPTSREYEATDFETIGGSVGVHPAQGASDKIASDFLAFLRNDATTEWYRLRFEEEYDVTPRSRAAPQFRPPLVVDEEIVPQGATAGLDSDAICQVAVLRVQRAVPGFIADDEYAPALGLVEEDQPALIVRAASRPVAVSIADEEFFAAGIAGFDEDGILPSTPRSQAIIPVFIADEEYAPTLTIEESDAPVSVPTPVARTVEPLIDADADLPIAPPQPFVLDEDSAAGIATRPQLVARPALAFCYEDDLPITPAPTLTVDEDYYWTPLQPRHTNRPAWQPITADDDLPATGVNEALFVTSTSGPRLGVTSSSSPRYGVTPVTRDQ